MKVFLMYRDADFSLKEDGPVKAADLTQDLELTTLFGAMAGGDALLLEVVKKAILASLQEPNAILYRQHILADCLERADVVREMYVIAVEAIEREKKIWGGMFAKYPAGLLSRSIDVLQILVEQIKKLRQLTDEHEPSSLRRLHQTLRDVSRGAERRISEHYPGPSAEARISARRSDERRTWQEQQGHSLHPSQAARYQTNVVSSGCGVG